MTHDDDRHIIEGLRCGHPDAAAMFVERYSDDILKYLRWLGIPRADYPDLSQEICFAAVTQLQAGHFQGRASLRTWVHQIAKGKANDYWRTYFRRPQPREMDSAPTVSARAGQWTDQEVALLLDEVLTTCQPRHALAFRAYYLHRLTIEDVAEQFGWSVSRAHEILTETRQRVVAALDGRC